MSPDKMVRMANQIAAFFATQPGDDMAARVSSHINDFWEPRMRRQFFEIVDNGGGELLPLVVEAARQINRPEPAAQPVD